jgi:hypothetical protein
LIDFVDSIIGGWSSTEIRALTTAGAIWLICGDAFMSVLLVMAGGFMPFAVYHYAIALASFLIMTVTIFPALAGWPLFFVTVATIVVYILGFWALSSETWCPAIVLFVLLGLLPWAHLFTMSMNDIAGTTLLISGVQGLPWCILCMLCAMCPSPFRHCLAGICMLNESKFDGDFELTKSFRAAQSSEARLMSLLVSMLGFFLVLVVLIMGMPNVYGLFYNEGLIFAGVFFILFSYFILPHILHFIED